MATQTLQNVTNVFDIPLHLIVRDKKMNTRSIEVKGNRLEEMMESMKKNGQMTPVRAWKREDGKFDLIFGYTRCEAAEQLKWETIRVEVEEKPAKDADRLRKVKGLAENLSREDLTPYDQAMGFLDLKKNHDMSGVGIGQHVGKSTSYVNNLMRIAENCEPVILDRWKKEVSAGFGVDKDGKQIPNTHRVCTMDWLTDIAANVPRAEQETALKRALGLIQDDDEEDGDGDDDDNDADGNPRQPGGNKRASMKALKEALKNAKAAEKDATGAEKERIKGMVQALNFATGHNVSIKGIYSPKAADSSDE